MPKESVDQWSQRIARHGGGRASAYLEEFEGDDDFEEEDEETDEERAYFQQEAARKKGILAEQAKARQALDERKRQIEEAEFAEKQEWAATLRGLVDDQIYTKNVLIKQMLGTLEPTPIGDEYFDYKPALLSRAGFDLAKSEIQAEAQKLVVRFQLAQAEKATRSERQLLALDAQRLYDRRAELDEQARGLGIDLSSRPRYPDPATLTSDVAIADQRRNAATELADIQLRLDLLAKKRWAPGDLAEFDAPTQSAHDNLVAALRANGALPTEAKAWVTTLNSHAKKLADAAAAEELQDSLTIFFASRPGQKPHKQLMMAFADEYGYDPGEWEAYKKAWNASRPKPADAPLDGVLTLAKLNAMSGGTAGQRYTPDEKFSQPVKDSDPIIYLYHLSVSYSPRAGTGLADITGMHVSFKTGTQDRKFWYTVKNGNVTFRETAGGAVAESDMHNRARGLLKKKSRSLRFRVVTP